MFYAIPIVYWLTWAFFIVNEMLTVGIFYATIATIITTFIVSKLKTGKWMWAFKTLFNKD